MLGWIGKWAGSKGMGRIPDLEGLSRANARNAIIAAGFNLGNETARGNSQGANSSNNGKAKGRDDTNELLNYEEVIDFEYYEYTETPVPPFFPFFPPYFPFFDPGSGCNYTYSQNWEYTDVVSVGNCVVINESNPQDGLRTVTYSTRFKRGTASGCADDTTTYRETGSFDVVENCTIESTSTTVYYGWCDQGTYEPVGPYSYSGTGTVTELCNQLYTDWDNTNGYPPQGWACGGTLSAGTPNCNPTPTPTPTQTTYCRDEIREDGLAACSSGLAIYNVCYSNSNYTGEISATWSQCYTPNTTTTTQAPTTTTTTQAPTTTTTTAAPTCPDPGSWSTWSTCSNGTQTRTRTNYEFVGGNCIPYTEEQSQACTTTTTTTTASSCDPAGTFLYDETPCQNGQKLSVFADGSCGTYSQMVPCTTPPFFPPYFPTFATTTTAAATTTTTAAATTTTTAAATTTTTAAATTTTTTSDPYCLASCQNCNSSGGFWDGSQCWY